MDMRQEDCYKFEGIPRFCLRKQNEMMDRQNEVKQLMGRCFIRLTPMGRWELGGLSGNAPILTHVNTWSLLGGAVWEGLGEGVSLEVGLEVSKAHTRSQVCLLPLNQDVKLWLLLPL